MPSARPTVRVQPGRRGRWEVMVPERGDRVACETLDDATRVAYEYAGRRSPCELVVRDAYYRVLRSEIIGGSQPRSRRRQPPRSTESRGAGRPASRDAKP